MRLDKRADLTVSDEGLEPVPGVAAHMRIGGAAKEGHRSGATGDGCAVRGEEVLHRADHDPGHRLGQILYA
ncbi:hypothetical protein [Streptomyces sp. V4I2]|uniref:hypothetical protein n=1 Tax=Streptomyces sp. V4I2 TaxID=3042280 RepID=UPI00277E41F4|nr:hypothetical protein [Streptomyces sp. V4I2]MDQ1044071.1 hypothetical protein [Streptomyces sp. V4I2]